MDLGKTRQSGRRGTAGGERLGGSAWWAGGLVWVEHWGEVKKFRITSDQ